MKRYLLPAALFICLQASANNPLDSYLEHESPEVRTAAKKVESAFISMIELLKTEEAWLVQKVRDCRIQLPEGVINPELTPLLYLLKDNLRCQLYVAEKRKNGGFCSPEKEQEIKDKLAAVNGGSSAANSSNFNLYTVGLESLPQSELVQHLLLDIKNAAIDWQTALEIEEALLRIRIDGIKDFNVTPEGKPYVEALKKNIEVQCEIAEKRYSEGVASAYEPILLQEKLKNWFGKQNLLADYEQHESPEVREQTDKYIHGEGSWLDVMLAEEIWLLQKITDAAREQRQLSPVEKQLVEDAAKPEGAALRSRLIWFPVPQNAEDQVIRLRQNLRCRLALAEKSLQAGNGSPEAVDEIRSKLALCPVLEGERDDSPADEQTLATYLTELESSSIPTVQAAMQRYKEGELSLADVLKTEATALHVRIIARAVLPCVPSECTAHLARLETNLMRQLVIAQQSPVGVGPSVLELREKLANWFSK